MEESQKGVSTSPSLKGKASLLDGEIGKDFLSSWKSMSVTENDAMDFDFGTVAKGKKKTFNFDNLDMDFSLDGDFDKISSFKVDMSDLDISSPAKKSGKPRERSKEETAGGNHQGKQDRFSFPFDFNDLDSFSFEPSLMKEEKKCNKTQVRKVSLNRSESQGSGAPLTDDVGVLEDVVTSKLPASEGVTTSKTETMVNVHEDLDHMNESSPSKSVINENRTAKSITSGNLVASQKARTSPENTIAAITQEKYQESHRPDQGTFPEPYVREMIQPIHDLYVQSVSENDSTHDTTSDVNGEVCSLAPKVIANSGQEQNSNVKAKAGFASDFGNSPSDNSEMNKFGSQNHVSGGNTDGTEAVQGDSDFEYNAITSVSGESLKDMKTKGVNLNSTSKLLSAPLSGGTSVDKLRGTSEKVSGSIRSKFFNRPNETKSQSQQALSSQTELTSFGSKIIGTQRPTDGIREGNIAKDAESGSKLAGSLRSYSGGIDKIELLQPRSGKNVIGLKNIGECMNADGAQSGSKLTGYSRPQDIEVSKGEPVLQGSGNNYKELHTFSSTEQTNKSILQNSVNPRLTVSSMASTKNVNNISVEGNKISPLTFGRGKTDLSNLKISRTKEANQDPLKSTFQGEIKSLRNTEQKSESQCNTASKLAHSIGTEKQTPPTPSLKRKSFEASNVDMLTLNPAKRQSESPTESRNFREPSERVGDQKTSTLHIPREMNMTEPDIALVMENDGSIERAEACTKELEDICNMLKKKHEEAKELLVRAIVNNNNLLMLNHPIYEEKIRMVQKFAAQLMSKELHT